MYCNVFNDMIKYVMYIFFHFQVRHPSNMNKFVYRHGQPNPDSLSTMRVWIKLPMSVLIWYASKSKMHGNYDKREYRCFQYPEIFSDSISKLIPKYIWTNKNILGSLVILDENLQLWRLFQKSWAESARRRKFSKIITKP